MHEKLKAACLQIFLTKFQDLIESQQLKQMTRFPPCMQEPKIQNHWDYILILIFQYSVQHQHNQSTVSLSVDVQHQHNQSKQLSINYQPANH